MDKKRNQRRKELEEKKRRLLEIKEKNKAKLSSGKAIKKKATQKSAEAEKTKQAIGGNVDEFLDSLNNLAGEVEKVLPTPLATSDPAESTIKKKHVSPPPSKPKPSADKHAQPKELSPSEKIAKLKVVNNIHVVDIPSKETQMYSKATQTLTVNSLDLPQSDEKPAEFQAGRNRRLSFSGSEDHNLSIMSDLEDPVEEEEEEEKVLTKEEIEEIENNSEFQSFLFQSGKVVERAMNVSSKYDIMADYARKESAQMSESEQSMKGLKLKRILFDDRWSKNRSVTDISWNKKFPELFLASFSANESGWQDPDGVVQVWSSMNLLERPEYIFNCQSAVTSAVFSPFQPTLVIGGTYSGQICLWDTRAGSQPVQKTPLSSNGHTHPVFCVNFVGSQNAHNLVTLSSDGRMCVWNLENFVAPQEFHELHNKQSIPITAASPVAATCLDFPPDENTIFFVGSEEGVVFQSARHGATPATTRYEGHFGPITSLDFHPSFPHLFLSASTDWSCKIWSSKNEEHRPLYSFEDFSDYVYDIQWSPTHPSLFATGDGLGNVGLWNLNVNTELPIVKQEIAKNSINKIRWSHDSKFIAVGDSIGNIHLLDTRDHAIPRADEGEIFQKTLTSLVDTSFKLKTDDSDDDDDLVD